MTAEAERQARQAIRRARREHPDARIIVTGCAATLSPERYAALAEVDCVLDNDGEAAAGELCRRLAARPPTLSRMRERETAPITLSRMRERVPEAAEGG